MTKIVRIAALATAAAGVALTATPASAQATQATASARINKPLVLTREADLNFGDILLSGTGAYTTTVSIAEDGTFTCGANLTCTNTNSRAVYNASGHRGTITINVDETLTLENEFEETLTMTVLAPEEVGLTNSGSPGTDFGIGGTLTLSNTTPDGTYSGTFNVTAEY